MELSEALNNRKSTRHYIDKKVDKSLLDEMLSVANLAPSWKNSQTPRFYVATGEKSKNAVREALPEFNRKNSENASAYIVTTVVLNRSGFDKDGTAVTEIGNGWGYYDLGLASENICLANMALLLKATELGISTLVMGIRDGEKLRKEFDIPETEAVVSVIVVGYTDSEIVRPKRKSVEDFAKFYED